MSQHRRFLTGAAVTSALVAAAVTGPVAGAAARHRAHRPTHHPSKTLKTGTYAVTASHAIDAIAPTLTYTSYHPDFQLFKRPWGQCGGPKGSTQSVDCLTAYSTTVGSYGTMSTTNDPTLCESQGYPDGVAAVGWTPLNRMPANGRLAVNTTLRDGDGQPEENIKVSIRITPAGAFSGTLDLTDYITTGTGPAFPGCTTGLVKLSGRWQTAY